MILGATVACGRAETGSVQVVVVSSDSAFTSGAGENLIEVEARGESMDTTQIRWNVERREGERWAKVSVPDGRKIAIPVRPMGVARLRGKHPSSPDSVAAQLDRLRLRYRIAAEASGSGATVRSTPIEITQSLVAAIRQEYLDVGLRHGAPPSAWFNETKSLPEGPSNGDYPIGVANPAFVATLKRLERVWRADYQLPWTLNSYYRNPIHNRFHVGGSGSGPVSNSWHQFGCAADLQTFPRLTRGRSPTADTLKAKDFWTALAEEALELGFEVEARDKDPTRPGRSYSGVGHVHIELDCPP